MDVLLKFILISIFGKIIIMKKLITLFFLCAFLSVQIVPAFASSNSLVVIENEGGDEKKDKKKKKKKAEDMSCCKKDEGANSSCCKKPEKNDKIEKK